VSIFKYEVQFAEDDPTLGEEVTLLRDVIKKTAPESAVFFVARKHYFWAASAFFSWALTVCFVAIFAVLLAAAGFSATAGAAAGEALTASAAEADMLKAPTIVVATREDISLLINFSS
jgi:hypothetical protein